MMECICKYGVVRMVLWDCSLKNEFCHFTCTIRVSKVSRLSKARVANLRLGLALGLGFSFSDRVGIGLPDMECVVLYIGFPTCSHSLRYFMHYLLRDASFNAGRVAQ